MMSVETALGSIDRRAFVFASAAAVAGSVMLPRQSAFAAQTNSDNPFIIGPLDGFSPQMGTLVSMMNFMRHTVIRRVEGLSQDELDHLFDSEANAIGALLLHLAAIEVVYQVRTFEGRGFTEKEERQWGAAQNLGDAGREQIKAHPLEYYLSILEEVRENTLDEFRKRDDAWLAEIDPSGFGGLPTNNFCKWFHVCEHEANHRGQIAWLVKRLPGHEFADAARG